MEEREREREMGGGGAGLTSCLCDRVASSEDGERGKTLMVRGRAVRGGRRGYAICRRAADRVLVTSFHPCKRENRREGRGVLPRLSLQYDSSPCFTHR